MKPDIYTYCIYNISIAIYCVLKLCGQEKKLDVSFWREREKQKSTKIQMGSTGFDHNCFHKLTSTGGKGMSRSILVFLLTGGCRLNLGGADDGGGDTNGGGEMGGLVSESTGSTRPSRSRDLHLYLNSVTFVRLNVGLVSEDWFTNRRMNRDIKDDVPLRCL